jgi:hypothetical protein
VLAALCAWWLWPRAARARHVPASRTVDLAAFRVQLGSQLERARKVAARRPEPIVPRPDGTWPQQGAGVTLGLSHGLLHPCDLGPRAVCDALEPLTRDCDGGDATACVAVGEYLADTPPFPASAGLYFFQACRIGDAASCARYFALREPSELPCAADPFACGWRATQGDDAVRLDEACSLGVADACAVLAWNETDDTFDRGYLEAACQLGSPLSCRDLARRTSPDCEEDCYEPDELEATAAFAIACEAGWPSDGCVTSPGGPAPPR